MFVRWIQYIAHGLGPLREPFWTLFKLEKTWRMWRYVILFECVALIDLADATPDRAYEADALERVLIIKMGHFGDALHVVPALKAIREQRPSAEVDFMVGPWCESLARKVCPQERVITYAPQVELFHRGQSRPCFSMREEVDFLRRLRQRRYDLILSASTTNLSELLVLFAAVPRCWTGVNPPTDQYPLRGKAVTVEYDSKAYEADRVMGLLKGVGLAPVDAALEYPLEEATRVAMESRLRDHGYHGDQPLVVLAPGAGWPGKCWPPERFASVTEHLQNRWNACIVLAGSRDEQNLGKIIERSLSGGVINLIGETSWDELAAMLSIADLFMGNDSAPMHLAAVYNRPSVVIFGPTFASKWAPRGDGVRVLQNDHDCSGCMCWHNRGKCLHANQCMKSITVEDVSRAADDLLGRPGSIGTNNQVQHT